ncbi:hypothetical protein [Microbacterium enclense]|uniref:hypothetical protein n=1 Tax=Microbacterium enclense TaxID=993073 RepID=UPI003D741ED4
MVRLDIDLAFSEEEAGRDATLPPFEGTITAAGSEVRVKISDPSRLPGNGRRTLAELSTIADALAKRGISVCVEGPDGPILHLGEVKSSVLQRVVTGSPHIRLGSVAALAPLLTRRKDGKTVAFPVPPGTPLPLVPTVNRVVRRRITTTHYTPGSGRPRLIFAVGSANYTGMRPREFDLLPTKTVIGSGDEADLRLPGLAPIHAEVRHEGDDEYVLYGFDVVGGGGAAVEGRRGNGRILRTGARIELGDWRLAYFRAEWADHGRPYGGRVGGELARQRKQPPRGGRGPLASASDPD